MKNILNKKMIVIIAVILALVSALILFFSSPAYKAISALKSGDSTETSINLSKVDDSVQKKLFLWMFPSAAKKINNKYNIDGIPLENVEKLYEIVIASETVDASEYYDEFKKLVSSKQSYGKAVSAKKKSDYVTAINQYRCVISTDSLYTAAQQELKNAIEEYKKKIDSAFYDFVGNGRLDRATELIDDAISVVSDAYFKKMKANLTTGIYDEICAFLNNISQWETITQSHAGYNTYCCYGIRVYKGDSNAFKCYYVAKLYNDLVQSGEVGSITGPVAFYTLNEGTIHKLRYSEEKQVEAITKSEYVRWDYTDSKVEKFKKLESLLT